MAVSPRIHEMTRLWTKAQPAVAAYIASMVIDFSVRDDILQDVAVAIVDSFDEFDSSRPFLPWALGVARNHIRNYLRRRNRDRHVFNSEAMQNVAQAIAAVAEEESCRFRFLQECLAALPDHSRQLCEMRYVGGLLPMAISDRTDQPANTVAKTLQRIRERLRECIERRLSLSEG